MDLHQLAAEAARVLGVPIHVTSTRRAWYYADETSSAYWITAADLRYALEVAETEPRDTYSHWCATTQLREMSAHAYAMVSR